MKRALVLIVVAATATFVGVPATHAATAQPALEAQFIDQINALRAANGLGPLAPDAASTAVARSWAGQMASAGQLYHNPNASSQLPSWTSWGENVGFGGSVDEIEGSFMSDAAHLNNLLSPSFDHVGVGVVTDAAGTLWAVQDFIGGGGGAQAPVAAPEAAPAPDVSSDVVTTDGTADDFSAWDLADPWSVSNSGDL